MRLIDANALLSKVMTVGIVDANGNYCGAGDVVLKDDIDDAPTIDPVKHGEWKTIIFHNGCTPDYDCVCSVCNKSGVPYYDYCPNCGAHMDGGTP